MASTLDELTRILTALDHGQLIHWYGPDAEPSLIAEQLRARILLDALDATADDEEEDGEPACEGHASENDDLMSGVNIGETTYCDGSCNPRRPTTAGTEEARSDDQFTQGQRVVVRRSIGVTLTGRVALEHTSRGFVGVRSDAEAWRITRYPRAKVSPFVPECPTCGAPADEKGTSIREHRPASPCTVDYRAI